MEDFASAAMMRLLVAGLAAQGIAVPPAPAGAHVPRNEKRGALAAVLDEFGPEAILRIGEAVRAMPSEPVLVALLKARDAGDLLERWRKLSRFSHARHEVRVEARGEASFRLRHRARDGGPDPSPPETLMVIGTLCALIERVIAAPIRLEADGRLWRAAGRWDASDDPWPRAFDLTTNGAAAAPTETPPRDGTLAAFLRTRIAADPVRRWTVAAAATEAGLGARSAQRHLAAEGLTFSRVVSEARLAVAADLLSDRDGPGLAAAGFLAGYTDQPHFTRSFSAAVGTPPGAYREAFAT